MLRHANAVGVSTATTGTGTLTLGSALSSLGLISFADGGVLDGDRVTYMIREGSSREVGRGYYSSAGPTLTRDTVLESTNANALLNLTGSAQVFITAAAEDMFSGLGRSFFVNHNISVFDRNPTGTGAVVAGGFTQKGPAFVPITGSTATGACSIRSQTNNSGIPIDLLQDGAFASTWARFPILATAVEDYTSEFGFTASWAFGGVGATGIYFQYDRSVSNFWQAITRNASTNTTTTTSVEVLANAESLLEILYRPSRVLFRINGAVVADHTTNIPPEGTTLPMAITLKKKAGTTQRQAEFASTLYGRAF